MKNLASVLFLVLVFAACEQASNTSTPDQPVLDKPALEKAAGALMDRFYALQKGTDLEALDFVIAEDVIAFGTAPDEIMDKAALFETMEKYKQDPAMAEILAGLEFDVSKRDIRLSEDGKQAIVTDLTNTSFSKLPIRSMAIMVKGKDDWKINYFSSGFLIKNEDIGKLDSLMTVE